MIVWKEEGQKVVELRKQGLSFEKIGKIYGISRQAVQQGLKIYLDTHNK